jgi:cell division protein FtsW
MFHKVGEGASVRRLVSFGKPAAPATQRRMVYLGIDLPLVLVVITLIIIGILMVYSASYDYSLSYFGDASYIFRRQMLWLGIGLVGLLTLAFVDYHYWLKFALLAMGFTISLLVVVLLINEVRNGAVRTLLGGSVQPSELAKLVSIIYLSVWLYNRKDQLSEVAFGLIPLAVMLGLLGGLIVVQPDLSAVITICFLGGTLFFLAGADLRQIAFLAIAALVVGYFVVTLNATGSGRVEEYLAGLKDWKSASYHVRRATEAFVKGGWFGVGIGNADTKLTGLPVPPTDSIFAVVVEETGLSGAVFLISLYLALLWRGLTIAHRAPDGLGALMAAGFSIWLAAEAFINMAVMLNLLPFAGNALPFISAGGSNLMVSLAAVGILINISRLSVQTQEENGRMFGAVVDLRRWDRRRRVPRSRRSSGHGV